MWARAGTTPARSRAPRGVDQVPAAGQVVQLRSGRRVRAFLPAQHQLAGADLCLRHQLTDQRGLAHAGLSDEGGDVPRTGRAQRGHAGISLRRDGQMGVAHRRIAFQLTGQLRGPRQLALVVHQRGADAGGGRGGEVAVDHEQIRHGQRRERHQHQGQIGNDGLLGGAQIGAIQTTGTRQHRGDVGLVMMGVDFAAHLVSAHDLELAAEGSGGALPALRIAHHEVSTEGCDDACGKAHGSDRMRLRHVKC